MGALHAMVVGGVLHVAPPELFVETAGVIEVLQGSSERYELRRHPIHAEIGRVEEEENCVLPIVEHVDSALSIQIFYRREKQIANEKQPHDKRGVLNWQEIYPNVVKVTFFRG